MKSVRVWIGSIVALFLVALLVAPASFGAPQQDKEKPAGGGAGSMDKMSQEDMQKMI